MATGMKTRGASQRILLPFAGGLLSCALFVTLPTLSTSASAALAQVTATNPAFAQTGPQTAPSRSTATAAAPLPRTEAKPSWKDLTPQQQQSLKPLAGKWSSLSEGRKRKWLELSKNYPSLPPAEQAKLHSRMTEWVSLSQQQRAQARFNYAETKELTPAQKAATWEAYQALSPEERRKLRANAPSKPSGAAAAVKPAPQQKLAVMPVTQPTTSRQPQKLAGSPHSVDQRTLLPQQAPPAEPSPAQKH